MCYQRLIRAIFLFLLFFFFNLNFNTLRVPNAYYLRWLFLSALLIFTVLGYDGKLTVPYKKIIVILTAITPSLTQSIDLVTSSSQLLIFVFFWIAVYTFLSCFHSIEALEQVFSSICVFSAVLSIISMIMFFVSPVYGAGRFLGITTNANTLGIYSSCGMISFFFLTEKTKSWKKVFMYCGFFGCLMLGFISGSRSAWIVMLLYLFFILFLKRDRFWVKMIFIMAFAIFVVLIEKGFLVSQIEQMMQGRELLADSGRARLWNVGLGIWRTSPIIGVGYNVSNLYNEFDKGDIWGIYHLGFHNSYITLLADVGIWGISLLGISSFRTWFKLFKHSIKEHRKTKKITAPMVASLWMIGLLTSAVTESFLFAIGSSEACLFWSIFIWGCVYCEKARVPDIVLTKESVT